MEQSDDEVVEELDVYFCNKEALGAQVKSHCNAGIGSLKSTVALRFATPSQDCITPI